MTIVQILVDELKTEADNTRKLLECVPEDKKDWKPHEKSFTLARMAGHVAEIPGWIYHIVELEEFDIRKNNFERFVFESKEQLMAAFEKKIKEAEDILNNTTDEHLQKSWSFLADGKLIYQNARYKELRKWAFSHLVHHRAQLGLYLRLLDVPIPGMYGPSADDRLRAAK